MARIQPNHTAPDPRRLLLEHELQPAPARRLPLSFCADCGQPATDPDPCNDDQSLCARCYAAAFRYLPF